MAFREMRRGNLAHSWKRSEGMAHNQKACGGRLELRVNVS